MSKSIRSVMRAYAAGKTPAASRPPAPALKRTPAASGHPHANLGTYLHPPKKGK